MRNVFVMLLIFLGCCHLANAQASFEPANKWESMPFSRNSNSLPEDVLKLLPPGLAGKVAQWSMADKKGHLITGWYINGQKAVTFAHKGGHLNGKWQAWYENGRSKEEGHFKKGYPDGNWKFWYETGMLRSERNFSAVKMQSMNIASRQRNPKLQFVPVSGTEPSSKETSNLNALIFDATTGRLHFEMPFRKALHEGDFVNYAEDGRIVEQGSFVNGFRDGKWLYYRQDEGSIITGNYLYGSKHGPWKILSGDTLISLSEYKDGKLLFQKSYQPSAPQKIK